MLYSFLYYALNTTFFQILFDFQRNKKYEQIPFDALSIAWASWSQKMHTKREVEKPDFRTIWSDEIESVLLLLLFLPSMSPKKVFGVSVTKFLCFHKVSEYIFLMNIVETVKRMISCSADQYSA